MSLDTLLTALQSTGWATQIREDGLLFPVIETVHVLAITFVVGTVAMVDLRLLGLASRGRSVSELTREIIPWTVGAFVVAAISGSLLFSSAAMKYFHNLPFRLKAVALVLAGANMAFYHLMTERGIADWDSVAAPPRAVRMAGGLSLLFWLGVIAAGRWIGFTYPNS